MCIYINYSRIEFDRLRSSDDFTAYFENRASVFFYFTFKILDFKRTTHQNLYAGYNGQRSKITLLRTRIVALEFEHE